MLAKCVTSCRACVHAITVTVCGRLFRFFYDSVCLNTIVAIGINMVAQSPVFKIIKVNDRAIYFLLKNGQYVLNQTALRGTAYTR